MSIGIDYGRGLVNIDTATGIRYGVISEHSVSPDSWYEVSEAEYGEPTCGHCGNTAVNASDIGKYFEDEPEWFEGKDYFCLSCEISFWSDDAFGYEPLGFTFKDDDYFAHCGTDGFGIWVEKSPFYTYAGFCSPCAPGAGDLDNAIGPNEHQNQLPDYGVRTYCFNHDWFDGGVAPYRVFRVDDNSEVLPEDK